MDVLPSEAVLPEGPGRLLRLPELQAKLKRAFFLFLAVWAVKILLWAFGVGVLTPFHGAIYRIWLFAHGAALLGMLVAFALFADASIRTAAALGRDRGLLWLYFAVFPVVAIGFPYLGPIPLGFFIYNAILGSPYVVYRQLANALEEELQALSALNS